MRRTLRRLAALTAASLLSGCGRLVVGPDRSADPVSVFESAWREIDLHYSFFAYKHIDWAAAHATYRAQITPASSDAQLRAVLCRMVGSLRSYHADLTAPTASCGYVGPSYPPNFQPSIVPRAMIDGTLRTSASGHLAYGLVASDVGYVGLRSFLGEGWGREIDDVLADLDARSGGAMRGLVIDIRGNQGGNDDIAAAIAARLADGDRLYQRARYRDGPGHDDFTPPLEKRIAPLGRHFGGPVAVLTNRANGSAAEDFLTMVRVFPTVITVGDTTIGNSSNPLWRELPNGWQLRIPQSIQETPEGMVIEGVGLAPTIAATLSPIDAARGVDTILRRAIGELRLRM